MSETDLGSVEPTLPTGDVTESPGSGGFLHMQEKQESQFLASNIQIASPENQPATPISPRAMERVGTVEHLAARRPVPQLDANAAEIKQQLSELRAEVTRLVTGLRWGGQSVGDTVERMIPLLNIGPIQQWQPVLIPFLFEIDRAGNLIPVWLRIIEQEELPDLPPSANPAETPLGRARRYAILMLGNYKSLDSFDQNKPVGFSKPSAGTLKIPEFVRVLGRLATNPNTSLYSTQALVQQSTTVSIQTLVGALKDAEGWAKVDVVEGILALKQARFHDLLIASGLDRAPGLESYIAIPLYRAIFLDRYLRGDADIPPRLSQQAALIFGQVLQDSTPRPGIDELPPAFDGNLSITASALFEGARRTPNWQYALAVHRLGIFLGRYWSEISRGTQQDSRIVESIYSVVPMMPEVERWMDGPGRDVLLHTLPDGNEESFLPIVKVLGELRDPRATSPLLTRLETTKELVSREQALSLAALCDTLARLADRRAVPPMLQLVERVVNVERRMALPKRRESLPAGDADIPGSIVYAAVVRASEQLEDRSALDTVLRATSDFDPYVRTQALEALKYLDPTGDDMRSRSAAREALDDPANTVVRSACQLVIQYRDVDAVPSLRRIVEARNDLSPAAYDALRQLGM